MQGVTTRSELGHGEGCRNAEGRHKDVFSVVLGVGQVLVEDDGKARVGLRQLPDPGVSGLRDLALALPWLLPLALLELLLRVAIDAHGVHRDVAGLRGANIFHDIGLRGSQAPDAEETHHKEMHCPGTRERAH